MLTLYRLDFIMGHVQVLVSRVALIVNVVMTNTEYLEDLSAGKLVQILLKIETTCS